MTAAEVRVITAFAAVARLLLDDAGWWRVDRAKAEARAAVVALLQEVGEVPLEELRDLVEIGERVGQAVPL